MIGKPIDQIVRADIEALVTNEVKEGRTIEYKQALPGNADKDRKEFLADVSSFANAAGGDLLYGIVEKRDADNKTTGIPESVPGIASINTDQEIRRLDSILKDGLGPRISGIHIRSIADFAEGPVLLIRVPKSYAAPHMVTFQEHSRFYSRNNGGKYPLDVAEIRSAFALSESLPDRIRRFREERLGRIVANDTPVRFNYASKVVLHVVPISAFTSRTAIDLNMLYQAGGLSLPCFDAVRHECRFNLDGLLSYATPPGEKSGPAYAQVFRTGIAEFVDVWTLAEPVSRNAFPVKTIEKSVVKGVAQYLKKMVPLDITPPIVVMLSILGVRGCNVLQAALSPIDRDNLILPDVLADDLNVDPPTLLRPVFDAMWQAGGIEGSRNYDKEGRWTGGNNA
jgi:Putative DNA-binding domain